MQLTIDGLNINYLDIGDKNQQTVLFLHGWGAPADTYLPMLQHLAQYCRVVAPDFAGFGGSDQPPENWGVGEYTDWVVTFCDALHLREVVLMCHSFGGRISIDLLSRNSVPLTVKKAVFLDAAGIRPKRGIGYYSKVYSYKCMKKLAGIPPIAKAFPALEQKVKKRSGSADYRNANERMRAVMVKCINEDLTPRLKDITASVLLIWGQLDTATPLSDGQCMEKLIPDAGLVVVPSAGHFACLENLPLVCRVLDSFLKG